MARTDHGVARGVTHTRSQPILAACFRGRPERKWLEAFRNGGLDLTFLDARVELVAHVLANRPRVVLLPAADADGVPCAPLIARLRERAPDVRVLLLLATGSPSLGLAEAMRAGGDPAFFRTKAELLGFVTRAGEADAISESDAEAIRSLVSGLHPPALVDALIHCAVHADRPLSVGDLADALGVSRRTFGRRTRLAAWPTPVEMIEWGRLLRASIVQWRESASLIALAHASGFRSPQALRRAAARRLVLRAGATNEFSPLQVGTALRRRLDDLARIAAARGSPA
jgi:AraC-like DNA-binding protein